MILYRIKKKIKELILRLFSLSRIPFSHAQAGEDVVIDFLFQQLGLLHPTYLEIGVCSPDSYNNTYKFYVRGARGVLVEADKSLLPNILGTRPADKLIHAGVSVSEAREADFYLFHDPGLSTFDKEEAERRHQGNFKIREVVKVPLLSINELISKNFAKYPDFLSIDIEGLDLPVLKSLDFERFPIPVICVETCSYSENHIKPKNYTIAEFMHSKGYFSYADTYINTIFVHEKWFMSVRQQ